MKPIYQKISDEGKPKRPRKEALPRPENDTKKGTRHRIIVCPDCGVERVRYGDSNYRRCVACTSKLRRNGWMVECPGCGTEHYIVPSMEEKGIRYCSIACANEHVERGPQTPETREKIAATKRGSRNPNFKHGKRTGSVRTFTVGRKGERACRVCGAQDGLHAHHAVPRSVAPAGREDLRNCIVLCASCHLSWHRGRPISREHFTDEEWAFIETLIGPTWLDKRYPKPEDIVDGYFWDDSGQRAA